MIFFHIFSIHFFTDLNDNPQTTNAPTFWTYNISALSGVDPISQNNSLNPLKFSLDRETDTQKKLSNFTKLPFFCDKIDQKTNFAKLPSAKCFLYKCNFLFIFQQYWEKMR